MQSTREHGEALFFQHLEQIERVVRAVAAQRRLDVEEVQELYSLVMLKMVQDDYAVLRGFQGRSRWITYLTVVVQRVLLDQRVKEWGRWRPCVLARRLGPTAVRLDRRINRDGMDSAEAIRDLLTRGVDETSAELEALAEQIPRRAQRRLMSGDKYLSMIVDRHEADRRVAASERKRAANCLTSALASALREIPASDRRLLELRFGRGWTVRRIAASENLEDRPLYRRFHSILRQLRRHLEHLGLSWTEIRAILGRPDVDLEISLR